MGFFIRILFSFLISYAAFSFDTSEEIYFIPGDITELAYAQNQQLFFRVGDNLDSTEPFILFEIKKLKDLKLKFVQFALKKNNIIAASNFKIKIKHNLNNYIKNNIISRGQWGACACKPGMISDKIKHRFAIHHSEGSALSCAATLKSIQNYHMKEKKWPDIGYHFLIGRDGICFEGRELSLQGAHVQEANKGNIGICLLGCFETTKAHNIQPTPQMLDKLAELIGTLATHFGIDLSRETIKGHKEHKEAQTLCPGDLILAHIAEIINKATHVKQSILTRI